MRRLKMIPSGRSLRIYDLAQNYRLATMRFWRTTRGIWERSSRKSPEYFVSKDVPFLSLETLLFAVPSCAIHQSSSAPLRKTTCRYVHVIHDRCRVTDDTYRHQPKK